MNLYDLQEEVSEWGQHNFPNTNAEQQLLGVVEELGELCHARLKAMQGIRGTVAEHEEAEMDAIGDMIIFLTRYCDFKGFNLHYIIEKTWNEVRARDWIKFPKNGKTE